MIFSHRRQKTHQSFCAAALGVHWDQAELSLWAFRVFFNRLNSPWNKNQFLLPTWFNQHSKKCDFFPKSKMTIGFLKILHLLPGFYCQAPLFIHSRCCVEWGLWIWKGPRIWFLEKIFVQLAFTSKTTGCKMPREFDEPFVWTHIEKWILWVMKVHVVYSVLFVLCFVTSPGMLVINYVICFFLFLNLSSVTS